MELSLKIDGLFHGKSYFFNGWFGGTPISGTPIWWSQSETPIGQPSLEDASLPPVVSAEQVHLEQCDVPKLTHSADLG